MLLHCNLPAQRRLARLRHARRSIFSPTVLCGWSADGIHLNYGSNPEPTIDAFVKAIVDCGGASTVVVLPVLVPLRYRPDLPFSCRVAAAIFSRRR
jgi:hypothetical protein